MRFTVAAVGITLLSAMTASAGEKKGAKVSLRAAPRVAPAPVTIVFNVELAGGEDGEDLYCPVLEWEWGDGTRSVEDEDCPSFEPGHTPVQRKFTVSHEYRDRARPRVIVTVRKGDRVLGTGQRQSHHRRPEAASPGAAIGRRRADSFRPPTAAAST